MVIANTKGLQGLHIEIQTLADLPHAYPNIPDIPNTIRSAESTNSLKGIRFS
jgi:hypothetical protein